MLEISAENCSRTPALVGCGRSAFTACMYRISASYRHQRFTLEVQVRVDGFLKENFRISKEAIKVSKLVVNASRIALVKPRDPNGAVEASSC